MKKLHLAFVFAVSTIALGWNFSETAAAEPIQIVVIGDSNVVGKGVSRSEAYPAKLERALKARGYDVGVVNAGRTGDTTDGVLARVDSDVPQGTKLAIVWVGINDLRSGASEATVEAGRQAIARRLRARGIPVILVGPRHGLRNQPQYLLGDPQFHLNPAGYDVVVARTLPAIRAVIERASKKNG